MTEPTPALPSEPEVLTCAMCTAVIPANILCLALGDRLCRACYEEWAPIANGGKTGQKIRALRARCAQLEGDVALIDFVQANHYSVMCWDVNGKINNGFTIGSDNGEMDDIAAGRTWRECVQWAMKRAARSTTTSGGDDE